MLSGKSLYLSAIFFLLVTPLSSQRDSLQIFTHTTKLMGSRFDFTLVAASKTKADQGIELAIKEIKRIENLISSWLPQSQTTLINENAGIQAVKIDWELLQLIKRSQRISELT